MPRVSSSYSAEQFKEKGPDSSCGKCGKQEKWLCETRQIPIYSEETLFNDDCPELECLEFWDPTKCCMVKRYVEKKAQPSKFLSFTNKTIEEKYWVKARTCKCAAQSSSSSSSDEEPIIITQPERRGCKPCGDRPLRGERRGEGRSYDKHGGKSYGDKSYVKSHKKK